MILDKETLDKFNLIPSRIPKFSTRLLIIKCDICGNIFEKSSFKVYSARKNSLSDIDVCFDIECIKKKRETTMLKKYGVSNAGQSIELRKKVDSTCLSKYGTKSPMQSNQCKAKFKKTCFEKYGSNHISNLEWVKEKVRSTTRKNYGVDYSTQSNIVIERRNNNNLKKYGVKNPMMLKSISSKTSKTQLDNIYNTLKNNKTIIPMFTREEFFGFTSPTIRFYKFKCNNCNTKFENNYIGLQCYKCDPLPRSNIEEELKTFISDNYLGIIKQNCRKEFDNKFEVDIFLPDIKIAIELNGNYYHSELHGNKHKYYHITKTKKCEEIGIKLIQIWEDEWNVNKNIIKNKILHILKIKRESSIFARKCILKPILFADSKNFLQKFHIQGSCQSSIQIGAFYNNELVSVMTFGKFRKIMGYKCTNDNYYELLRFSTNGNIVGIAGKILSYFIKNYNPEKIVSYADRRWTHSSDNVYTKLKFIKISDGTPNYWYVHKTNFQKRYHRFSFRKSELKSKLKIFDDSLSEWENMKNNGYDRIWDCGNLKYEWSK